MFNDDYIKQKVNEVMDKTKNMTEEELNQHFIEYFGMDAFKREQTLSKLHSFQYYLSDLIGISPLPIIYDDIQQDSVLDIKNECIIINIKFGDDLIESAKCVAHEQRHYYQLALIQTYPDDPLAKRLKEEFSKPAEVKDINDIEQLFKYACQEKEIDAFAFTQIVIKDYYKIDTYHPDKTYQSIIDLYKKKYYIN